MVPAIIVLFLVFIVLVSGTTIFVGALLFDLGIDVRLSFHTRFLMALFLWATIFYFAWKIGRSFFQPRVQEILIGESMDYYLVDWKRSHVRLTSSSRLKSDVQNARPKARSLRHDLAA